MEGAITPTIHVDDTARSPRSVSRAAGPGGCRTIGRSAPVVLLTALMLFAIHKGPYLLMYVQQARTGGHFCMLTSKGDTGYTYDLVAAAKQIRFVHDAGFTLFRPDPYHCENSGKTFPEGNLVYALCALPMLFTDNIETAFIIDAAVSILLSTWLLCYAAGLWSQRPVSRAAFLSAFLLSVVMVWLCGGWPMDIVHKLEVVLGRTSMPRDLGYVGRFPHVEFTVLILSAWYAALLKVMTDGKASSAMLLGLALAATQYSYFYYWTACAAATFFALVVFARPQNMLRTYFITTAVYAVLSLPMLLRFFAFQHSAFGEEYGARIGVELGRQPSHVASAFLLVAFVFFLIDFWSCRLIDRQRGFVPTVLAAVKKSSLQLSVLMSYALWTNIQVLAGKTSQRYHWEVAFYGVMVGILIFPYLLRVDEILERAFSQWLSRALHVAATTAAVVVVLLAIGSQLRYAQAWTPYFTNSGDEQAVIDFIRADHLRGPLWCNNTNLNLDIGAHTSLPVLFGTSFCAFSSDRECLERLVYGFHRMGYSADQIMAELRKGERWLDYLKALRERGNVAPYFLDGSRDLDNYGILTLLGHRRYLQNRQGKECYVVPEGMAATVADLCRRFSKPGPAPFRVATLLYDKRILPAGVRPGKMGNHKILLENDTFVLVSLP